MASAPPVVPVPSDPLALVPPDAQTFFTLDVAAVVKARSFDSWRNAATRYACIPKDDIDWATSSTTRMIFVTRGTHPKTEVLGVLVGKYTEPDVLRAIRLVQRLDAKQDNTGESAQRGRFTVTTLGSLSGAQLEGRILLVGSTAMVQSAIDLIEAPPAAPFATTEPFKHLSAQLACDHHSVCAVIAPSSEGTRVLKRLLANVNMAELGKRLVGVASGMSADLESGLAFSTVSEMASADDAAVAQKQLNDWLWQLGVVARFAGFPDVIDEIKVQVEG
ncbi:MAG TPA: hypothetical protein VHM19_09790, partial [Polyangiales bacterium]|nr:hypothetical protein [Polyangiales bacterium]